jgi:hypothetical protein
MKEITIVLGVTTALLHGVAYILYSQQVKLGKSNPNAASWGVWAFLAILNALSYREMSGDVVASLQFFASSVACFLTFLYALSIGKFSRLTLGEWGLSALGLSSTIVWWQFRSATGANMIVLAAVITSFIPTLKGVWLDPFKEVPRSWILWTLAYLITTVNVILREGRPVTLITPVLLLIGHGLVAILSTQKRKERFRQAA